MSFPPIPSAYDTAEDRADAAAFLTSARAVIAAPESWAGQCQWAFDPDGRAVDAHDPTALRWSASAALRFAARQAGGNAVWLGWTALDASVGPHFTAFEWASDTTHEVMLRVFDLAIARLIGGSGSATSDPDDDGPHDGDEVHDLAVRVANELLDQALDPTSGLDVEHRRGNLLLGASTEREGARRAGAEPAGPDVLRSQVEALNDLERDRT